MLIIIHIVGVLILACLILFLYATILVNRDNKTERELKIAKNIIKQQNEKILLLESELNELEREELDLL